jgi:wyosine [tRNA(Phe)-imidazoG37] synthetase (radical SAM superfamily)
VRDELALADWVSVKVDAATEPVWRRVNRPHRRLAFDQLLGGLEAFARQRSGCLVTETMLVGGVNDSQDEIEALSLRIAAIAPSTAWLGVPTRPPAESWVTPPGAVSFDRALQTFIGRLPDVRLLLDRDTQRWAPVDTECARILAIAAVHPLSDTDIDDMRRRSDGARVRVETLLRAGRLESVVHGGQRFYRTVPARSSSANGSPDFAPGGHHESPRRH